MAETTKDIQKEKAEQRAEQKRIQNILDTINKDNYKDYVNEPMFAYDAVKPKGLTRNQEKNWNAFHYQINKDYDDAQKAKEGKSTDTGAEVVGNSFASQSNSAPGSTSGSTSGSNSTSKAAPKPAIEIMDDIIGNHKETVESYSADTNKKTSLLGKQKNFDTNKGRTQDGYIGFASLNRDKKRAKRELEKAELGNERLQQYLDIKSQYEDAVKQLEQNKNNGASYQELDGQLAELNGAIAGCDAAIAEIKQSEEWINGTDNPELKQKLQAISDNQAQLSAERQIIFEQIKKQEPYEELMLKVVNLAQRQLEVTKEGISALGQWTAEGGYNKDAQYKLKIAEAMTSKIDKIFEDGQISEEEQNKLGEIFDGIDTLIEEERDSDPAIREAQDEYDSAKSKFSYYLFDQIKSLLVLLVGLSTGNAQMVYSAMDMYNKKIADAEAEYTTDEIKAFSNNNMKEITGSADAQYSMEQILPALEQNKVFKQLDANDKAMAVEALYQAFQEYKNYSNEMDFAAWFTTQQDNGSGWAGVIKTLIQAGALNADTLGTMFKNMFTSQSNDGGVSYNLDTKGKTDSIIDSVLKGMESENAMAQVDPKVIRDKQGTVQNVLASRMGGQGAAPQGGGTAQPVNSSWGQA